jgi:CRISPR system Cascade subunit CasB
MPPPPPDRFVVRLEGLRDRGDLGALAALRRGLGKDAWETPEMFPHVVPWLPGDASRWDEACHFLIGALFAWHPLSDRPEDGVRRNLGYSFARLSSALTEESVERRFSALLVSNRDELADRLRAAVGLLRAREVPVDWNQLLRDLRWWGAESRRVERAWARSFWSPVPHPEPES